MFTQVSVHAFDMLSQVHISLEVRQQEHDHEPAEVVLHRTATIEGLGVTDPRDWAYDALVALIESL